MVIRVEFSLQKFRRGTSERSKRIALGNVGINMSRCPRISQVLRYVDVVKNIRIYKKRKIKRICIYVKEIS